jgi:epsilon-lactone hydrolase
LTIIRVIFNNKMRKNMAIQVAFGSQNYNTAVQLSDAAQEIIKTRARFTDYLSPEIWPLCRDGFKSSVSGDSDKAKEALLQAVQERMIEGCRVLELTPKTYSGARKVILYMHGGAFALGAPECQMQIPAPIAHRTGWKVLSLDYPLAPYSNTNDPHPAHTAAFQVYKSLLQEYQPSEIAFLADSAGGSIAFGTALMAKGQGVALPGAIVSYAPWVDMEQTSKTYSDEARINQTVVLTPPSLASARDAAFGKQTTYSSYVSPIHGNYEGFSSMAVAIYTAGRDLLREEGETLAEKLRPTAKSVESFCKEGMWHGFQEHYGMPEAEETADKASRFMQHHLV